MFGQEGTVRRFVEPSREVARIRERRIRMSDPRNKLKSMGRSFMVSLATAAQEVLGRDTALSTLKIDTKNDDYKDVIWKLAYAIVGLQEQVAELRAEVVELQRNSGTY